MKLTIENGLLYIDNKRYCHARVQDGSEALRSEPREVSTQYSEAYRGRILPYVADLGWIADDNECLIRIGSVLGNDGPIKCTMSVSGLVARIEACEDLGIPVLIEIK